MKIKIFVYGKTIVYSLKHLFLTVLGPRCCVGFSLVAVHGAFHCGGLSCTDSKACEFQ